MSWRGSYQLYAFGAVLLQATTVIVLKHAATMCGSSFCWHMSPWYLAAVASILIRVVVWNMALARGRLSDVYVFTALHPILLLCLAIAFLGERVSAVSAVGAAMIVTAIYFSQRECGRNHAGN